MKFDTPPVHGRLIKRYKRFLADVLLDNGEVVTAHCTNSGSMKTCIEEGAPVYLSPVNDPKRKTKFTWEMIYINNGWVGINTSVPNPLVFEAIKNNEIEELKGYTVLKREVRFGDSRFDIYAANHREECFIEVKNVTMKQGKYALFPDAVTLRGRKHLVTLTEVLKKGMRAVMVYVVQRGDVSVFAPAREIDPDYAEALTDVYKKGVEVIPLQAEVSPRGYRIVKKLPFDPEGGPG